MTNTLGFRKREYKENWLFITGLGIFSVFGLLMIFIIDFDKYLNSSRLQYLDIELNVFVVFSVLIAPLLEEFSFRANFCRSKILKIISIVVLTTYIITTGTNNYLIYLTFVIYITSYGIVIFGNSHLIKRITYALNAVLFGLIHYKLTDLNSIHTGSQVLIQLALGFILIWVFLNFKLIGSIIAHILYNGILIFAAVFSLTHPNTEFQYFKNDDINMKFNKSEFNLSDEGDIMIYKDSITCTKCLPLNVLKYNSKRGYNIIDYVPAENFVRYDIKVYSESIDFVQDDNAFDFLIESGLLLKK